MRTRRLHRGSLRFDIYDAGPASGEPVILLHGFPQDCTSWNRVLPRLHAAALRTVTFDQRGYSAGARPRSRTAYRLEHLVADVRAVLRATGPAHVVGHDWGGVVAWGLAARSPEQVRTLTIASTPHPRAFARALVCSDQALRSSYIGLFQLPVVAETVLARHLPGALERTGLPAADAARYTARMAEPGALTAALNWYRAIPLTRCLIGKVPVPTTYVWGAHDFALGRRAAEATGAEIGGPYRFVELDAGHWLPETAPAEVAAAVIASAQPAS